MEKKLQEKMSRWNVYIGGVIFDRVSFLESMSASEVYDSLVKHDNYNPRIVVRKYEP